MKQRFILPRCGYSWHLDIEAVHRAFACRAIRFVCYGTVCGYGITNDHFRMTNNLTCRARVLDREARWLASKMQAPSTRANIPSTRFRGPISVRAVGWHLEQPTTRKRKGNATTEKDILWTLTLLHSVKGYRQHIRIRFQMGLAFSLPIMRGPNRGDRVGLATFSVKWASQSAELPGFRVAGAGNSRISIHKRLSKAAPLANRPAGLRVVGMPGLSNWRPRAGWVSQSG